eukprot:472331-Rhodomonas_salina.1
MRQSLFQRNRQTGAHSFAVLRAASLGRAHHDGGDAEEEEVGECERTQRAPQLLLEVGLRHRHVHHPPLPWTPAPSLKTSLRSPTHSHSSTLNHSVYLLSTVALPPPLRRRLLLRHLQLPSRLAPAPPRAHQPQMMFRDSVSTVGERYRTRPHEPSEPSRGSAPRVVLISPLPAPPHNRIRSHTCLRPRTSVCSYTRFCFAQARCVPAGGSGCTGENNDMRLSAHTT